MTMNVNIDFSSFQLSSSPSYYITGLACVLVAANSLGFVTTEPFKRDLLKLNLKTTNPQARLMNVYENDMNVMNQPLTLLFRIYQLPMALALLAFANGSGYVEQYGPALVLLVLPELILGDMKQKDSFWTCPKSFGVRGMTVGTFAALAIYNVLDSKEAEGMGRAFEVLSLASFANAAWHSCGVGSVAGWAAHPELGEFGTEKRLELAHMQVYFILGFVFRFAATKV